MGRSRAVPAARKSQYFSKFVEDKIPSMTGKVVVITGTTSGTGFVAALTVAKKGAKVIVLNRKSSRAEESLEKLQAGAPGSSIEWIECDLQSFGSVVEATKKVFQACPDGIDVLCNNAGVMALEDKATVDGYDVQMQTNHLSHFLLTKELYPLLKKAADAKGESRVVNHSSLLRNQPRHKLRAASFGKNGGNLGGNGTGQVIPGGRWKRYQQTKLANTCFSYAFTERANAAGSKVVMLSAHPGLSATNLQLTSAADGGFGANIINKWVINNFSQSPEDGTMGLLQCMCGEGIKGGQLWGPKRLAGKAYAISPGKYTNKKNGDLLW
eukprot:CAMPEP_0184011650 /NCGR_PEP_ID=MMETSP0954-20121128/3947_1 /TAXON_ID=627963 /ORGANISM="Aplanochytrium sp, Strain PBS07" /LENGTH=324 /DNA_ID=CAMNT_0026291495 /DNA_START=73 /DNA_END=1044 /DNA_ORIENTATION=+